MSGCWQAFEQNRSSEPPNTGSQLADPMAQAQPRNPGLILIPSLPYRALSATDL
ncbi:hypothetical protein SAMN04490208_4749 [Pseudomonas poae]|uniref:Uncharacterized protein n=1 Tax=Pseudomonas poae TaxID=200451 RepID=A0ABY0S2I5_9PSED|nr:hypothetical protein SAMN04490208_4749 [Pseudomonas poae]